MKKNVLCIMLCLVLLLSMSTTAYATETITGGTSATVTGTIESLEEAATVYSVEIKWGSLEFTYEVPNQVWNPDTHQYEDEEGAEPQWTCTTDNDATTVDANEIRVVNRSNAGIDVTVTTDMGESGITADVDNGTFTLESADATITDTVTTGTETSNSATITLSGELASDHEAGSAIGTVTVTLAAAQSAADPDTTE